MCRGRRWLVRERCGRQPAQGVAARACIYVRACSPSTVNAGCDPLCVCVPLKVWEPCGLYLLWLYSLWLKVWEPCGHESRAVPKALGSRLFGASPPVSPLLRPEARDSLSSFSL